MKKIILVTLLSGMFLLSACGEVQQESTVDSSSTQTETATAEQTVTTEISETNEPDTEITVISSSQIQTESSQTQATTVTTITETVQTAETFPEPEESQPFETDENGAVIMEVEDNTDDSEIISAAQELYENACKTEFRYHVGCPYNLDFSNYIENQYGWPYYLVTDEGYTSIADVEKDYYKIFAEENGNDLSEIYMEQDGKLYALDGERGANIFYKSSEVTGIIEKSENKIVFSVDNHYTGDDKNPETPITETEQFSVIIKNGEWRVAEFYLPY